jgi:hypothetical protein
MIIPENKKDKKFWDDIEVDPESVLMRTFSSAKPISLICMAGSYIIAVVVFP